jgi:hypothetical protein
MRELEIVSVESANDIYDQTARDEDGSGLLDLGARMRPETDLAVGRRQLDGIVLR